jgi:hypothetical protein
MASAIYLTEQDITALVASGFNTTEYVNRTNDHLEYIGYSLGVTPTGIITPIHFLLKEYARAWCMRELYKDKIGANNTDNIEQDKYLLLYNIQNDEVEKIQKYLTPEIMGNSVDEPSDTAGGTFTIFRC